ncbi:MAG: hypothetical protein K2Y01_05835 [Rhabdochlamydiaceae bacterium]|nr:hypothetical protein [Rhabdochlamydiaceae bacterium]
MLIGGNHKSALGTLVERTTRYLILVPIPGKKDAKSVREAFSEVLQGIDPSVRLSKPYDGDLYLLTAHLRSHVLHLCLEFE